MKRFFGTVLATVVFTTGVATTAFAEGKIERRKERQQARIAQGGKSGELTAGETAHLEKKEAALNKEIRTERKANGGNLTNNEKAQVNRQQNRLSRKIYKEKHDAETQKR